MSDSSADRDPLDRLAEGFVARYRTLRSDRPKAQANLRNMLRADTPRAIRLPSAIASVPIATEQLLPSA
jgi:hypothetical protein